jgi:hypothetical protein
MATRPPAAADTRITSFLIGSPRCSFTAFPGDYGHDAGAEGSATSARRPISICARPLTSREPRTVRFVIVRRVLGVVCCLIGAVWIGQGIGLIGGSFMTDQVIWAVIGAIAVLIGVVLFIPPRRTPDG